MSASNEPAFDAEYRKYGSLPDLKPVCANHFCNIGALLETIKNGSPTIAARQPNNQKDGLPVRGTEFTQNSVRVIGNESRATPKRSSCTTNCCLNVRRETTTAYPYPANNAA